MREKRHRVLELLAKGTINVSEAEQLLDAFEQSVEATGEDELFEPSVRLIVANQRVSASTLQRKFRIGYTRAVTLLEQMEERGVIGPEQGAEPREVLAEPAEVDALFA